MQNALSDPLVQRAIRAAKLDGAVYEEVEHDSNATSQAFMIVALAAVSAGIGGLRDGGRGLIFGVAAAIIGYVVSSYFIYFVGTRLTPSKSTEADLGQVLRCRGFAEAPGVLLFLNVIPGIGPVLAAVVGIWTLVTSVIATMHALEMSALRAIATVVIAAIAAGIVAAIIAGILGVSFGLAGAF